MVARSPPTPACPWSTQGPVPAPCSYPKAPGCLGEGEGQASTIANLPSPASTDMYAVVYWGRCVVPAGCVPYTVPSDWGVQLGCPCTHPGPSCPGCGPHQCEEAMDNFSTLVGLRPFRVSLQVTDSSWLLFHSVG